MNGYFPNFPALACASILTGFSTLASAQTCPSPTELLWIADMYSASTCGGEPAVLTLCSGAVQTNAPAFVARLRVGDGATAELSLAGSISTPMVVLLVGADCDDGPCLSAEPPSPLSLAGVAPGEYNLIVTSNPAIGMPGACDAFSLSYVGDFGVFDRIFADGLD